MIVEDNRTQAEKDTHRWLVVKPCKTCPHRVENANTVYQVWGDLPTLGKEVARVIGEPHACHYSLDDDGNETLDSWPCAGWP